MYEAALQASSTLFSEPFLINRTVISQDAAGDQISSIDLGLRCTLPSATQARFLGLSLMLDYRKWLHRRTLRQNLRGRANAEIVILTLDLSRDCLRAVIFDAAACWFPHSEHTLRPARQISSALDDDAFSRDSVASETAQRESNAPELSNGLNATRCPTPGLLPFTKKLLAKGPLPKQMHCVWRPSLT